MLSTAEASALAASLNDFNGTASANFNAMQADSFNEFYNTNIVAAIGFEVQHTDTSLRTNSFLLERPRAVSIWTRSWPT